MRKLRAVSPFAYRGRLVVLRGLGVLVFGLVLVKLAAVQFLWKDTLNSAFERQLHRQREITAPRGSISDCRDNLMAVELLHYYDVELNPRQIRNVERTAELIQPVSGRSLKELKELLGEECSKASPRSRLILNRNVPEPLVRPLKSKLIHGFYLSRTGMRIYPQGQVAGNLLGILNHENQPIGGLEAGYHNRLRGIHGQEVVITTAGGRELAVVDSESREATPGHDLKLFLDLRCQAIAEEELAAAVGKWNALSGQVVLLDPADGSLLALASWPPLDPNNRAGYTPEAARVRCISDMYEPGSTYKLVTYAALLEAGLLDDFDEGIYCHKGAYRVANRVIHDSDRDGYDTLSVREIFALSSNIGTAVLAERMEREKLYVMSRNFGFGQQLGIDLPGEAAGLLLPLDRWGPVEYANIAMGQGVAATALQVAAAFGAVANDGVLVKPRLLAAVQDEKGLEESERVVIRRVMSPATARRLQELLIYTVNEGTGKRAASERVRIGGKTGTAQKLKPEGGYSNRDYIASFAGFADVNGRRLAGLVLVDTPRGAVYGGTVAAPVFKQIMERYAESDEDRRLPLDPVIWAGDTNRELPPLKLPEEALLSELRP